MFNWLGDRQFSREYIDFLRIVYHQMVRKGPFQGIFGDRRLCKVSESDRLPHSMIAFSTRMRLILFRCNLAFIIPR